MSQNLGYCVKIWHRQLLADEAEQVFDLVWRFDFTAPGFAVIDTGSTLDSHGLRSLMVDVKQRLNEISVRRGHKPFVYHSLARFDQQETTKFHLDGAPAESLLMLGYEPSKIRSRLFLACHSALQKGPLIGASKGTSERLYRLVVINGPF